MLVQKAEEIEWNQEFNFKRDFCSQLPVIFRNVLDPNLPLDEAINSQLDSSMTALSVLKARDNMHFIDNELFTRKEQISKDEIMALMQRKQQGSRSYCRSQSPVDVLEAIGKNKIISRLFASFQDQPVIKDDLCQLWISDAGCVTTMHYDRCQGLLVQLKGKKRFMIIDRIHGHKCYLYDNGEGPSHASRIRNLNQAIQEKWDMYPKLRNVPVIQADLNPGDMIHIPVGFLHEVTSLTSSVSVTLPWDATENELEDLPRCMKF